MIHATAEAIATAVKNEMKMTGYRIEEFACVPGNFYVFGPKGQIYVVNIRPGVEYCSCPQFKAEGICKHYCRIEKDAQLIAEAAERDDALDLQTTAELHAFAQYGH